MKAFQIVVESADGEKRTIGGTNRKTGVWSPYTFGERETAAAWAKDAGFSKFHIKSIEVKQ